LIFFFFFFFFFSSSFSTSLNSIHSNSFKGHLNDTMNYHLSRLGTGAAPLNPNTHILADGGFPNINPLIIPFNEATANANPALAVP